LNALNFFFFVFFFAKNAAVSACYAYNRRGTIMLGGRLKDEHKIM